jgi:hypothetical protein
MKPIKTSVARTKIGDLVAGYYNGQYWLGMISKLNKGTGEGNEVIWLSGHWHGHVSSNYLPDEMFTIIKLREQFLQWQREGFK